MRRETDYSKHTHFPWKIKWSLEHLGSLRIMGHTSPLISSLPCFPSFRSQGAYVGIFSGAALALWIFIGAQFYPPNKYPGLSSVKECPFYKDALDARGSYVNGTWTNSSEILDKYGDGLLHNAFKPHE